MRANFQVSTKELSSQSPCISRVEQLREVISYCIENKSATIKCIRKNFRPLCLENEMCFQESWIEALAKNYWIPDFIVSECITHFQHCWIIPWVVLNYDTDAEEWMQAVGITVQELIRTLQMNQWLSWDSFNHIDQFFQQLAKLPIMQTVKKRQWRKSDLPRWLLRTLSLNDIDFSQFTSPRQYLDFLLINVKAQQKMFLQHYPTLIQENWWLPVDDIPEKITTKLAQELLVIPWKNIQWNGKEYTTHMRLIPWFSPVWIDISLWIDFPDHEWWVITNQNYVAIVWVQFEQQGWTVVPVIHTIQKTTHNVWINEQGDLIGITEPFDNELILTSAQRVKLYDELSKQYGTIWLVKEHLITHLEWNNVCDFLKENLPHGICKKYGQTWADQKFFPEIANALCEEIVKEKLDIALFLVKCMSCFLFAQWYKKIQIINPQENRWLTNHTQDRQNTISKSMENMYTQKWLLLWWKILPSWRVEVYDYDIVRTEIQKQPLSHGALSVDRFVQWLLQQCPWLRNLENESSLNRLFAYSALKRKI